MQRTLFYKGSQVSGEVQWRESSSIFIFVLDHFGAEVIRKLLQYDPLLNDDHELHWVWLGVGKPPFLVDWSSEFDLTLGTAHPENGDPLPVTDWMSAEGEALQDHWRTSFNKVGVESENHHQCLIVGSLIDTRSVAIGIAQLEAFFGEERLLRIWRTCSFWALSEETVTLPDRKKTSQWIDAAKVSATALFERYQSRREAAGETYRPLAPQFVVGRGLSETSPLLPRRESALILAVGMLARLYEIRGRVSENESDRLVSLPDSLVSFDYLRTAERPQIAGRAARKLAPFVHLGGVIVSHNATLFNTATAAIILEYWHAALDRQQHPEPDLGPAIETNQAAILSTLQRFRNRAMEIATEEFYTRGLPRNGTVGDLSIEWLDQTIGWKQVFDTWSDGVERYYGWDHISEQPLEDWDQSLQEIEAVAETFFKTERATFLRNFYRIGATSIDAAIKRVIEEVCVEEQLSSTGKLQPNLFGRRVLFSLREHFTTLLQDSEVAAAEESDQQPPLDEIDYEKAPRMIHDYHRKLKKTIRRTPSPHAFWATVPAIFAISLVIFQRYDFGYYIKYSEEAIFWLKLAKGLLGGAILSGWTLYRMFSFKKRIRDLYGLWYHWMMAYYRSYHIRTSIELRHRVMLFGKRLCEWIARDPSAFVNHPDPDDKPGWMSLAEFAPDIDDDSLPLGSEAQFGREQSLHEFIHGYHDTHRKQQQKYRDLFDTIADDYGSSPREIILPHLDRDTGRATLRELIARTDGLEIRADSLVDSFGRFLTRLSTRISNDLTGPLPYLLRSAEVNETTPACWKGDVTRKPEVPGKDTWWTISPRTPHTAVETLAAYLGESAPLFAGGIHRLVEENLLEDTVADENRGLVRDSTFSRINERRQPVCPVQSPSRSLLFAPLDDTFVGRFLADGEQAFIVDDLPLYGFLTAGTDVVVEDILANFRDPTDRHPQSEADEETAETETKESA